VAGQIGGPAGDAILTAAQSAFVDAMSTTSLIGIVFALAGAGVAWFWLPARAEVAEPTAVALDAVPAAG
jgi:hypothetical protein